MKTTMKTILSIFMVTVLFYACDTGTNLPAPLNLDCNGIEDGSAISDDCGDCHKWLVYNNSTHATREVNDTTSEVLGDNEMFTSPNNPMNPAWNFCPDCMGVSNGLAAVDSCGDCHQSYVYDVVTHVPTYINDTTGLVLGATEMIVIAGSPEDIASNPNWNTGCTE